MILVWIASPALMWRRAANGVPGACPAVGVLPRGKHGNGDAAQVARGCCNPPRGRTRVGLGGRARQFHVRGAACEHGLHRNLDVLSDTILGEESNEISGWATTLASSEGTRLP